MALTEEPLLKVQNLKVHFYTLRGVVHALERVAFSLNRQETLGLAGETGCGKSVTARAVLRLIDPPGRIISGSIAFEGQNLLALDEPAMRKIRGSKISMIMQEPKMSLNPDQPLYSIKGNVPSLLEPQTSCRFAPRCEWVMDRCRHELPPLYKLNGDHQAACFLHET